MDNPSGGPSAPPPPELKTWLLVQLLGGIVTMAGILACIYALAQQKEAGLPLHVPQAAWLLPAGVLVHAAGRVKARGLKR